MIVRYFSTSRDQTVKVHHVLTCQCWDEECTTLDFASPIIVVSLIESLISNDQSLILAVS